MSSSILERGSSFSAGNIEFSSTQIAMDSALANFSRQAGDISSLAAMSVGSFAFRFARLGFLEGASSLRLLQAAPRLTQGLAYTLALGTEVSAFRTVNHILNTPPTLEGGGIFDADGWRGTFTDFLALKAMGHLGAGQNLIVTHMAQSNAMVIGHELSARFGFTTHEEGSYLDRLVRAEITNIQMGAGMALMGMATGGRVQAYEHTLDAQLHAITHSQSIQTSPSRWPLGPALAGAAVGPTSSVSFEKPPGEEFVNRPLQMSAQDEDARAVTEVRAAPPIAQMPNDGTPATVDIPRRELPFTPTRRNVADTHNFTNLTLSLRDRAGYVRSSRRISTHGINLETSTIIPMDGAAEYAPYGANPTEEIRVDPVRGLEVLTGKWDFGAVITMSGALLGLGEAVNLPYDVSRILKAVEHVNAETLLRRARKIEIIAGAMGQVIMSGKTKWLRDPAGVSAFPISYTHYFTDAEVRELLDLPEQQIPEKMREFQSMGFARFVRAYAPNVGAINLEDLSLRQLAHVLPYMREHLEGKNAVWDDDMQGTGVVFAAYVHSWLKHSSIQHPGRNWENATFLIHGAGAGGYGVYYELINNGARPENITVTDTKGVLWEGREDIQNDPFKKFMSQGTRRVKVEEAHKGVHVLINLGSPDVFTKDPAATERMIRELAEDGAVIAGTNPEGGLTPEQVETWRPDIYFGSGKQTLENCANNFLAFPHVIGGSLIARAGGMGDLMTRHAALTVSDLAELGPDPAFAAKLPADRREFGRHFLLPHPRDLRLLREMTAVAKAAPRENRVVRAALPEGIHLSNPPTEAELRIFDAYVDREIAIREEEVLFYRERVARDAPTRLRIRYRDYYAPFRLPDATQNEWEVPPNVEMNELNYFAKELKVQEASWKNLRGRDKLKPRALTTALLDLRDAALEGNERSRSIRRELEIITYMTQIYPSFGLALAIKRATLSHTESGTYQTIFHDPNTLGLVRDVMPEAMNDIREAFPTIPRVTPE